MDRTFDLGPLQIHASLQGERDDQPVFKATISSPGGSVVLDVGTELPLPSEAALFMVREMRKVLRMGPQKHAQLVVLREKLMPERARAKQEESARLSAVAKGVPGGDASLAAAETALQEALAAERAQFEAEAVETAEDVAEGGAVGFDLGPVRMTVELTGIMPEPGGGELAVFKITAEAPGVPPHAANVATNAPLFSGAAGWLLGEMSKALAFGPEGYMAREMKEGMFKTAEDTRSYAQSLFAIASAVGPAGLDHAAAELAKASAQEQADAEEAELRRLEEEQAEIRSQIEALKRPSRRRPRGR